MDEDLPSGQVWCHVKVLETEPDSTTRKTNSNYCNTMKLDFEIWEKASGVLANYIEEKSIWMIWKNWYLWKNQEVQQVSQKGCEETLFSTGNNHFSIRILSIASLVMKYECKNWIKIKVNEIWRPNIFRSGISNALNHLSERKRKSLLLSYFLSWMST